MQRILQQGIKTVQKRGRLNAQNEIWERGMGPRGAHGKSDRKEVGEAQRYGKDGVHIEKRYGKRTEKGYVKTHRNRYGNMDTQKLHAATRRYTHTHTDTHTVHRHTQIHADTHKGLRHPSSECDHGLVRSRCPRR